MFGKHSVLAASVLATSAFLGCAPAYADPVNATLHVQYFNVAHGTDTDFSGGPGFSGAMPIVAAGSSLGPDGLPVGTGVHDLVNGQITWWSPLFNQNVVSTGTGTVDLSYNSNMYSPNSTGTDDSTFYETAILTGHFTLASASTVGFNLGSDDDVFIYVDGTLFGQNPGIHAVTDVDFTTPTLSAGSHSLEVFYADRESTGAFLSLSLDANSGGVVITPSSAPEPASWAMMLSGFGVIGGAMRSRRKTAVSFG